MQLLEYFLWLYQDERKGKNMSEDECYRKNNIVSLVTYILLLAQVLWIFCGITFLLLYTDNNYYKANNLVVSFFFCVFVAILIITGILFAKSFLDDDGAIKKDLCSKKDNISCRMEWDAFTKAYEYNRPMAWSIIALYLLLGFGYSVYFSYIKYNTAGDVKYGKMSVYLGSFVYLLALIASLIYSAIVSKDENGNKKDPDDKDDLNMIAIYGSFWCFLVIAIIIIK